jgi:hypothetical protein
MGMIMTDLFTERHKNMVESRLNEGIDSRKKLEWNKGLVNAYKAIGAPLSNQYAWCSFDAENKCYVLSVEIDHANTVNNIFNHRAGVFSKRVPPLTQTSNNSKGFFDAVSIHNVKGKPCRVIFLKNTKSSVKPCNKVTGAYGGLWSVEYLDGTAESGYELMITAL